MIFFGKTCSNVHTCSIENINFFMKHESLILDKEVMFNVWVSVGDQCPHCGQCQCQVTHHVSCVSNVPFDAGEFMNHRCVPDQGSGTIILKIYLYIHSYSLYYLVCLHYIISFSQKWFKLQKYIFFPKKGELKCWLFGGIRPSDCM